MSDLEELELTDEEKMMNLLEELQRENEQLKASQKPLEPLLQTIREQEQEITQQNYLLLEERRQNEKLLELAKSEKKLHEENEKLKREIAKLKSENTNLGLNYKLEKDKSENLQDQLNKATKLDITDDLKRFTASIKVADKSIAAVKIASCFNTFCVLLFIGFVGVSLYLMFNIHANQKTAEKHTTAIERALYGEDGYSVLFGSQASRPE